MNDIKEIILTSTKPVTKLIQKGKNFKVTSIGLNKGVTLKEHKAPGRTKLYVAQGKIEYRTSDYSTVFTEFDEYDIPLEELHEVYAHEPSMFLLIMGE